MEACLGEQDQQDAVRGELVSTKDPIDGFKEAEAPSPYSTLPKMVPFLSDQSRIPLSEPAGRGADQAEGLLFVFPEAKEVRSEQECSQAAAHQPHPSSSSHPCYEADSTPAAPAHTEHELSWDLEQA